ncbi:leukocyte elastase inhibitor-like isoform X2 [Microplitis demolitor]|uniref:leukocyte elastase inhibitor-like isoform X2 n=1 Tax=Microplitis demolitor TaxID=69319 RepID=UPI00235B6A56|nr:leukocyte elastase inhibitor-like isoform X2 [Microplitis demolitor]
MTRLLSAIKAEPTFYKFSTKFTEVALESHKNNLICSPLSAAIALSMITYGVRNKSEEELVSALYYPKYNKYNDIYNIKTFLDNLNNFKDLDLHIANKLFIAKKFLVKPEFKELTRIYYQSESENVDFTKPQEAADLINDWSARKTNDRIKEIVKADNFDVDTSLVLVNAIYLKAKWLNSFYADNTKLLPFYINSEEYKNVPMMYQKNEFKCGNIEDLRAEYIELPYKGVSHMGSTVSMYIFLPYEGSSLKTIEENLHKLRATDFHHNYNKLTIKLQLPRFKLDSTIDLKSHLIKMGVNEIFKATDNFYDISDSRPLKVTNVIQKAFIDVDENGSEAGAITAFRVESRMLDDSNVKSFNVNRPFIMLISTPRNILFSARITDPSL